MGIVTGDLVVERDERKPWFGAAPAMVDGKAAELRFFEGTRMQNRRVGSVFVFSENSMERGMNWDCNPRYWAANRRRGYC